MNATAKKYLCICQCGHSRSVALARVLHSLGQSAVAIGSHTSGDAIGVLSQWADEILVLQPHFGKHVPDSQRHKVAVFDVGVDRWSNPYNQELLNILRKMVAAKLGLH